MKVFKLSIYTLFISLIFSSFVHSQAETTPLKPISLQLMWKHQFQFAGYYIAKEKGYYQDAGFDVNISEYKNGLNITQDVVDGKIDFAIGRSSLILERTKNKPVVMLSAIFQHSPIILLSKVRDDIKQLKDLENKKLMFTEDQVGLASVRAMLLSVGLTDNKYKVQKHSFNVDDLVKNKSDAMIAYISNEPFALKELGIDFITFDPKIHGFDLYSDILYTSQALVEQSPDVVNLFNKASLKGWDYAMSNPQEAIELILNKYNTQNKTQAALKFEAKAMIDLIDQSNATLGNIDPVRIEKNIQLYRLMGLVKNNQTIDGLIYSGNSFSQTRHNKQNINLHPLISQQDLKGFLDKIKYQVSKRLYDVDTENLSQEISSHLDDNPWVRAITLVESIDNEKVLQFYRQDNKAVYHQAIEGKNNSVFNDTFTAFIESEKLNKYQVELFHDDESVGYISIYYKVKGLNNNFTAKELYWLENNTIKVGIETWPPLLYLENGVANGLVGEFLNKVIKNTGLKVELINKDWDSLLIELQSGKIDLIPSAYHSEERTKKGLYSDPYFTVREKLYIKNTEQNIHSLKDLAGKTLALVKGFATIKQIKQQYPEIKIIETDDFKQSVQFVVNGRADALFDSEVNASSFFREHSILSLKGISDFSVKANKLHFYSHKSKPILHSILQKGLNQLSQIERNKIISHWSLSNNALNLSTKEQEWIEKQGVINYVYDPDWAPFEYTNEVGQHVGIISDIIDKVRNITGIKFVSKKTETWKKSIALAKSNEVDMYSGVGVTVERSKYMSFSEKNIFSTPYIFVSRIGEDYLEGFDAIEGKKIAVVDGYTIHGIISNDRPKLPLVLLKDVRSGFEQLLNGDIDIFIVNSVTAKHFMNNKDYDELKRAYRTEYLLALKIAIRKDWPEEVLSIINKSIAKISDKELEVIYDKWTQVEAEAVIDYELLLKIAAAFIVLIIGFSFWNRKLNALVKEKTRDLEALSSDLEVQVKEKTKDLNKQLKISQISERKQQELIIKINEQSQISKEAEEKSRLLLTSVGEGIFGVDENGLVNFINQSALDMLQYDESELVGKEIHHIIHHTHKDGSPFDVSNCPMFHAYRDGKVSQIDDDVLWRKDGSFFQVEYKARPILKDNTIKGSVVTFSNITERKKAEQRLGLTQYAVDHAVQCAFWVRLFDASIEYANNTSCTELGYTQSELLWMSLTDIDSNFSMAKWSEWVDNLRVNDYLRIKSKQKRKDGSEFPVEMTCYITQFEDAETIIIFSQNITERELARKQLVSEVADRKQSEHLAEHAKNRLENITNNIPGVVYQFQSSDDAIIVKFISDGIKQLHQLEPKDLISDFNLFIQSIHLDDQALVRKAIEDAAKYVKPLSCDYRVQLDNGETRWVSIEASTSVIQNDDKDVFLFDDSDMTKEVQFNGNLIDVTEAKLAHQQVLKQQSEISEIHRHTRESIEYAALIQSALIPDNKIFQHYFEESFAIWHPKDIVGGDIYLVESINDNEVVIMVIDCTGHGVPGAFVTMLVKAVERQIMANIYNDSHVSPANILRIFNRSIKHLLKQEDIESISNAGFDGGIVYFNKEEKILRFAGAETPLFVIQQGKIRMIKGDRHSIGYKKSNIDYEFTDHEIDVSEPTQIYLTTDGYFDQNGGKKGFPFGKKRFKALLEEYEAESLADQQEVLLYELQNYQEQEERNDDVTVVGFRV